MPVDDQLHGLSSRYLSSPQWVKSIVGGAYAMLPARLRHGSAYSRFLRVFSEAEVSQEYIHDRLAQTLIAAISGTDALARYKSFLGDVTHHPKEVLAQLPLCSKEEIKANLGSYVNRDLPATAKLRMFTGGSTSIPMSFYVHKGISRAKEWAAFHAMGRRFGTEGDGVILALRGRTVRTAGPGRIWMFEPIKKHLIASSDHLEPQYMSRYVEALQKWRPSYIHAFPSALYPLVMWLKENGREDLLSQVQGVVLTSESVYDHHLATFRSFFRCPVIVTYGHTERVLLANTLANDSRYHFWPHYGYLELVDDRGHQVRAPGTTGEIVGTSFDNLAMPFIRYRTGDYAVLGSESSAMAPGFPVLDRIEGRLQEFVVCRDHRLITVTTLGAAHFEQLDRCLRIQYEQHEPGLLTLRVVAIAQLDGATLSAVAKAVAEKTQGGCQVRVEQVDRIPLTAAGKQRLLIQHLDIDSYLGSAISRASARS